MNFSKLVVRSSCEETPHKSVYSKLDIEQIGVFSSKNKTAYVILCRFTFCYRDLISKRFYDEIIYENHHLKMYN